MIENGCWKSVVRSFGFCLFISCKHTVETVKQPLLLFFILVLVVKRLATLKMISLHIFWPDLFTSYFFLLYLSSESYSRKYEKLPNIVNRACKNIKD